MSDQQSQPRRLLTLNRRVYQTYYIAFNRTRSVRLRTKSLNFLGIAIPLVGGFIVSNVYTNHNVSSIVLLITGIFALAQVVMSLWALSDGWDRQSNLNEMTLAKFSELRGELQRLRPNSTGSYDESRIWDIERRSAVGLSYDDELGVSDDERTEAWDVAIKRFPDLLTTSILTPSVEVQKTPVVGPEEARFGVMLGFALGRLEFVDGSRFPEAKPTEQSLRLEIKQLLSRENNDALAMAIDKDARTLIAVILIHFSTRNLKTHAAILTGIGGLRLSLLNNSSPSNDKEMMINLALSAFMEIDTHVISDRRALFDRVAALDQFNIQEICRALATVPLV